MLLESLKPYMLRRLKSQVLKELPDVTEIDYPVELVSKQMDLYKEIWNKRHEISTEDGSHFSVLSKLRKICDGTRESSLNSKIQAAGEIVKKIKDNSEKVIIFSYYLDPLYAMQEYLEMNDIDYVKFFDVDVEHREESVNQFKEDTSTTVFLASSRIASEGLTLTEANNVIFINRWWNPSSNSQARDRVVRIGQEKPVTIFNLFCAETVEERVTEILHEKNEIYSKVTDGLVDDLNSISEDLMNE